MDLIVDHFSPILRGEYYVIFAHPLCVRQTIAFVCHGVVVICSSTLLIKVSKYKAKLIICYIATFLLFHGGEGKKGSNY